MKSLARGCFIALVLGACSPEPTGSRDHRDLLARSPEEDGSGPGTEVDLERGRAVLGPGAAVRYRLEPLAPGSLQVEARAHGEGTLEAAFAVIDRATGAEGPEVRWRFELRASELLARTLPWPGDGNLLELRLSWVAAAAGAELELTRLRRLEEGPVARPSFVLISIDTLSARHLSIHGYPIETTPELRRIASEAYVFEACLANSTWTVPSFMSLLTGLHARAHELDGPGVELWEHWYLPPSRWTLAEFLRAAGYRTAGFVDHAWLTEELGFTQGFEVYDNSAAGEKGPEGGIRRTTALARAFLEQLPPGTPHFVFVHALDVHGPYHKAPPLDQAPGDAAHYDLARTAPAGGPNTFGIIPTYIARGEVPEGPIPTPLHTAPFERDYDEGVRFVDAALGEFFDWLRAAGILERSWVIVTADHGENMADSELLFGHGVLDPDVVHVPLVVRPPGGLVRETRIRETVQLLDLYPTLVDLALPGARHAQLQGRPLGRLMRGEVRPPRVVLSQSGLMRQAMLVTAGWKLVELEPGVGSTEEVLLSYAQLSPEWLAKTARSVLAKPPGRRRSLLGWRRDEGLVRDFLVRLPARGLTEELFAAMRARDGYRSLVAFLRTALKGPFYELYDLERDPRCERSVAREQPEKLAELQALLRREKERAERARAAAAAPPGPVDLPGETIEDLRALGYGGSDDE